MKWLHYISEAV